jgi:predicted metalloprotease with PDZ domain
VRTANQDGWLKITQVLDHALAQQAGLAPDDVIVSLNQERVTPTNWLKLLEQFSTQPLKILAFRSDQLKTFYIPNRIKPITEYVLQVP